MIVLSWRAVGKAAFHIAVCLLLPIRVFAQETLDSPAEAIERHLALGKSGNLIGAARFVLEWAAAAKSGQADPSEIAVVLLGGATSAMRASDRELTQTLIQDAWASSKQNGRFRFERDNLLLFTNQLGKLAIGIGRIDLAAEILIQQEPQCRVASATACAEFSNTLATAETQLQRYPQAVNRFRSTLERLNTSVDSERSLALVLTSNMVGAFIHAGDFAAARSAAMNLGSLARSQGEIGTVQFVSARLALSSGEFGKAETLLKSAASNPSLAPSFRVQVQFMLAGLLADRGSFVDAISLLEAARETIRGLGPYSPDMAKTFYAEGIYRADMGNFDGARSAFAEADAIYTTGFKATSLPALALRLELGWLDFRTGRHDRALAASAAVIQSTRPLPRSVGVKLRAQAQTLAGASAIATGQRQKAVAALTAATKEFYASVRGNQRPLGVETAILYMAKAHLALRDDKAAEAHLNKVVEILSGDVGAKPKLAEAYALLAELSLRRRERKKALDFSRSSYAALKSGPLLAKAGRDFGASSGTDRDLRELLAAHARILVDAGTQESLEEAFEVAQEAAFSRAAEAVQLAQHLRAAQSSELGGLLRQRQALVNAYLGRQWNPETGAVGQSGLKNSGDRARLLDQISETDQRINAQNREFAATYVQRFVTASDAQKALSDDEAILVPVLTKGALVVCFVRRGDVSVASVPIDEDRIARAISIIRTSVDFQKARQAGYLPTFPSDHAEFLYKTILSPFERKMDGIRRLLVVPDRVFDAIPPQLLIRRAANGAPEWLVERYAATIIPSLPSFVASRRAGQAKIAIEAFLGVGNPSSHLPRNPNAGRGGTRAEMFRALSQLAALPETEAELRNVIRSLAPQRSVLLLGENANKPKLKQADLGSYNVVSFATHAVMPWQIAELTEPAIVLTPGSAEEDDGLLRASEIGQLIINADLVILSACNTASSDGKYGAEGLSGLARAFFSSGAQRVIASHWEVESEATVRFMSSFFQAFERGSVDMAIAFQRASQSMLATERNHPAYWAPFVLVSR